MQKSTSLGSFSADEAEVELANRVTPSFEKTRSHAQVWWIAIRPKTLSAAFAPIIVGTALASSLTGKVSPGLSFFALLSALLIQIGTNLINDAKDFEKGADTLERLGPIRITAKGYMSSKRVMMSGLFCFALAVILGLPLVYVGREVVICIGILSLLAGYLYTAGPYPLAYHGWGEVFVVAFFGWAAVGGVFYLHTLSWDPAVAIAATQIGLLATVLIAINNLRDVKTDIQADKKTLAVRWGITFGRCEITTLGVLPFVLGLYWWSERGMLWAFLLPLLTLPLMLWIVRQIWKTAPSPQYNRYLAKAGLLQMLFGGLLAWGLVW